MRNKKKRLLIIEPCAARAAGVAHSPLLDRQASWHQCLTECRRVEGIFSAECAKRLKKKEEEKNPSDGGRTQSPGVPQGIAKVIPTRSALDIQGERYPNAICGSLEG